MTTQVGQGGRIERGQQAPRRTRGKKVDGRKLQAPSYKGILFCMFQSLGIAVMLISYLHERAATVRGVILGRNGLSPPRRTLQFYRFFNLSINEVGFSILTPGPPLEFFPNPSPSLPCPSGFSADPSPQSSAEGKGNFQAVTYLK